MPLLCSSCAATVPDGARFCGECGASMLARCGSCGTAAAGPGQRFCLECGAPLSAGSQPASTTKGVERRQVSVLFADLTGFTAFSESRDAEDVREMLAEYFESARRIIGSYGGRIEKFIGDAVMALWGAPVAREDDAERAVRAALELVPAISQLGEKIGVPLRIRVGVLTGRAAVELDAVDEGMVIGDAINTASRIQSVAEPGSVLVDDVTRSVTAKAIAYEDWGAHTLKGKADPVHTWRALRVVGAVGGVERSELEPPLVGRDEELATLKRALDALIEGGGLQLISIVGEPGLGKSRLAWELEKYADGLAATILWHHGQALSFGHGAGFSALAEMVRERAKIALDEPRGAQREKLRSLVGRELGDGDAAGRALRGLDRLLGLDDGSERIELGELFSSWRLLFEHLAARQPVVLVFEDLHWADQGLFDFIAHLREWSARSRILVLVFSRPDERLDVLAERGARIDLAPLSEEQIEDLVGAAVEGAPDSLLSSVREHAAGVPLFAVESLRMLANRGVMVAEGDTHRYRLIGEVEDLEVPPSIHALIAARLDQLGDFEREVLRGGAVLGQRFSGSGAAALARVGRGDARALLGQLVSKQFLTLDSDPRSQARGTYAFVHRQVQRVVLDTLSKRERKARHLAAADYLAEHAHGPDRAAILAGHLVAAFDAHPDAEDAPEIRTRALGLTLEAAQRADAVGALNEAVRLFAQAERIETDDSRRAGYLVRAARCAERYGNLEEVAARHYASAREIHERAGRTREALRLRARELFVYDWTRSPSELVDPLGEVFEELKGEQDAAFADAAAALASVLYGSGEAEVAERIAAQAAAAAEQAGAHEELGLALNCRASALIELARPDEALELFQAALANNQRYAASDVSVSLCNIAVTLTALGRFEEAVGAAREAIAAGERLANRMHRNSAMLFLARALFSLGSWDEAVAAIDEVAAETAPANRGMAIGPPILVALHRGELERLHELIDEFDRFQADSQAAFESDYRSLREVALAYLARDGAAASGVIDRAHSGDYAEWPTWLPVAVGIVAGIGGERPLREAAAALARDLVPNSSPIVAAQRARVEALLAAHAGAVADATVRWDEAIAIASSAGMVFDAAVLTLERFEHAPQHDGAEQGMDGALETFRRLRAAPWLERALQATSAPA